MPRVLCAANPGGIADIQKECQGKKHSSGPPNHEPCTLRELRGHGGAGGKGGGKGRGRGGEEKGRGGGRGAGGQGGVRDRLQMCKIGRAHV